MKGKKKEGMAEVGEENSWTCRQEMSGCVSGHRAI